MISPGFTRNAGYYKSRLESREIQLVLDFSIDSDEHIERSLGFAQQIPVLPPNLGNRPDRMTPPRTPAFTHSSKRIRTTAGSLLPAR